VRISNWNGIAANNRGFTSAHTTVEEDLPTEIEFLLGFDRARSRLNELYDWPGQSLDLFIRVVHQNDNKLSKTKRGSHFKWMTDDEINTAQVVVVAEFAQNEN
jgi:hypothetical protein